MSKKESNIARWWNSTATRRATGAVYSLGAAVVIIGAMFKILHLPYAEILLGVGMSVEACLFALGAFDRPYKEYNWNKVFDFSGDDKYGTHTSQLQSESNQHAVGLNYSDSINDDDVKKLSEGIKNLSTTAQQLSGLSNAVSVTDQFVKNIEGASQAAGKFTKTQETLTTASSVLTTSYQGISNGMETVEKQTKVYAGKVEDINKNLSSINSIYEIQLKNIQAQSEGLKQQNESVRSVASELNVIAGDVQKMRNATLLSAQETEKFKDGTVKLAKQVADLNHVYGNMLNALS